jgi:hypothetical protein
VLAPLRMLSLTCRQSSLLLDALGRHLVGGLLLFVVVLVPWMTRRFLSHGCVDDLSLEICWWELVLKPSESLARSPSVPTTPVFINVVFLTRCGFKSIWPAGWKPGLPLRGRRMMAVLSSFPSLVASSCLASSLGLLGVLGFRLPVMGRVSLAPLCLAGNQPLVLPFLFCLVVVCESALFFFLWFCFFVPCCCCALGPPKVASLYLFLLS